MATTVARLQAVLTADTKKFDRAMDTSSSRMKKVSNAAGVAGLAIAGGLAVAAKIGFDEFRQGQLVAAQTEAVLKSTGGTANVTAKEIDSLAKSIMQKTGIDDEAVKSGENMLLTFTKIRNEVGAGNDIFTQATQITTDLSVAMGKDMQSSAILVGKALNDPIKGLTALTRVGVSFTAAQKEQIKSLEASGKHMQAQKIILRELNTEFGGSAEAAGKTFAGQVNILRESLSNMAGELVGALMPAITDLVGVLMTAATWMQKNQKATKLLVIGLAALAAALIAAKIAQVAMNLAVLANPYVAAAVAIGILAAALVVLWRKSEQARKVMIAFGLAIAPLPVGLALLWRASETFRDIVTGAFNAVKAAVQGVIVAFKWLRDNGGHALGTLWAKIQKILGFLIDRFDELKAGIGAIVDGFKWIIDKAGAVGSAFSKADPRNWGGPSIFDKLRAEQAWASGVTGVPSPASGVSQQLWDEIGLGKAMGLYLSSGFRPGDTDSKHGYGKAIDMAGPAASMLSFAKAVIGRPGIDEVFYDPLGYSQDRGRVVPWTLGDHWDHVHVGIFDKGGALRPGWNLAYNGTGRPEPVGAMPDRLYLDLGDLGVVELVRKGKQRFEKLNGPGSW